MNRTAIHAHCPMASIKIERYDPQRHLNPMRYMDDVQGKRHTKAPTLFDYHVCLVSVCSFTFYFHSAAQLKLCLDYYLREHQPSGRLPFGIGNFGGRSLGCPALV